MQKQDKVSRFVDRQRERISLRFAQGMKEDEIFEELCGFHDRHLLWEAIIRIRLGL